ncbi:MAG TPA: heme-binding protein [Chloroflexota bacterium]|jgi:ferredoxin--NADP+ reductase
MPYVITDLCTRDGSCVEVCPVACIHTTPDAPQFYVDPDICIECEQCVVVCPVDAIFLDVDVPPERQASIDVNAAFFRQNKALAEPPPLEKALAMIQAAQGYAARTGIAVSVAVVDEAGAPIALSRMDGAHPTTSELAYHKAYTAAGLWVSTQELVAEARAPWLRSLAVAHRGRLLPAGGGIPIIDGVVIVGAIGVAGGARDEQDVLCCRAGIAAWESPHGH